MFIPKPGEKVKIDNHYKIMEYTVIRADAHWTMLSTGSGAFRVRTSKLMDNNETINQPNPVEEIDKSDKYDHYRFGV